MIQKLLLNRHNLLSISIMGLRGSSLIVKFLFTIYIAKILGFRELGLFGLISSGAIISRVFLGLSLMHVISRNAVTQSLSELCRSLNYYLRYTILCYTILFLIASVVGIICNDFSLTVLIVFVFIVEHISSDFYSLLLNLSRPFVANFLHFIRTAFWMIAFMATAYIVPDFRTIDTILVFWFCGGLSSLIGVVYIVKNWPWAKDKNPISLKSWVQKEYAYSKTMYYTDCMKTVSSYWNHFFITFLLGLNLTGVYVYFMQLVSAIANLVQTGVIQITRPKLVKAHKEKSINFILIYQQGMIRMLLTTIPLGIGAGLAFYGVTIYLEKELAIQWIGILFPCSILILVTMISEVNKLVFYSMYRDDLIFKLALIGVVLSMLIKALLITYYSLWGAVIAAIIINVILLFIEFKYIKALSIKGANTTNV